MDLPTHTADFEQFLRILRREGRPRHLPFYEHIAGPGMMGVIGLSYALLEQPELVRAMFDKIGELIVSTDRQLATMDAVGALRQGDDLGFKTSTFLALGDLRSYVFPTYRRMVEICFADGYYAPGTGNSLTDYMPAEHYLWALDEGRKVCGEAAYN